MPRTTPTIPDAPSPAATDPDSAPPALSPAGPGSWVWNEAERSFVRAPGRSGAPASTADEGTRQ